MEQRKEISNYTKEYRKRFLNVATHTLSWVWYRMFQYLVIYRPLNPVDSAVHNSVYPITWLQKSISQNNLPILSETCFRHSLHHTRRIATRHKIRLGNHKRHKRVIIRRIIVYKEASRLQKDTDSDNKVCVFAAE